MLSKSVFCIFISLFKWIHYSHAWHLDSSCEPYRILIEQGVATAVQQATDARDALAKRPWASPANDDFINLAQWTMKESGSTTPLVLDLLSNGAPNLKNYFYNADKFQAIYQGVIDQKTEKPFDVSASNNKANLDTLICCDIKRIDEPTPNKKYWYDSTIMADIASQLCQPQKLGIVTMDTLAETYVTYESKPSVIQICPDYLKKIMEVKEKDLPKALTGPLDWDSRLQKAFSDPIDAYAAFGTTLLHEFTHTFRCGSANDDSDLKLFGLPFKGHGPYQWGNVSKKKKEIAWRNADNIAYFALGIELLGKDFKLTEDGKVTK